MQPRRILFLYTELAGYFIAGLKELGIQGNEVTVVHWPVNPEAPFHIPVLENVKFIVRSSSDSKPISALFESLQPDVVLCSGWIDKGYISALRRFKKRKPTVLLMDTQWNGGLKQSLMAQVGGHFLRRIFSHAWVAGESQRTYALKMGFDSDQVKTGFYSADTAHFEKMYQSRIAAIQRSFPKKFVYLGRYVAHKGVTDLWKAFVLAKKRHTSDWKLICIGTGETFESRMIHEDIEHLGFLQPLELNEVLGGAGVFVLPSHVEPWGVVVHEMAQAGFPMILSHNVGAGATFLESSVNGFSFKPKDIDELAERMVDFMSKSDTELLHMAKASHVKADVINIKKWCETLRLFT